ncbi:MAG: hypothetical protein J0I11_03615 [Actinobacteria bacterium]|jgi:enoyl-[acyl-carrier-protein] reductase (NADH)|nr:hypothetical protein [Actinomycetota bacterium]
MTLRIGAKLPQSGAITADEFPQAAQHLADAFVFLTSDMSAGITGHLLPVDCGMR